MLPVSSRDSDPASAQLASGNYFTALGVRAAVGRTLMPDDDRDAAQPVVVISYRYWQRQYGLDTAVVHKSITIGATTFSFSGAALGVVIANWGKRLFVVWINRADPSFVLEPKLDVRVLLFTTMAAVITGLVIGLLPALRATRLDVSSWSRPPRNTRLERGQRGWIRSSRSGTTEVEGDTPAGAGDPRMGGEAAISLAATTRRRSIFRLDSHRRGGEFPCRSVSR
jgi:hypothetical protein